MAGILRQQSKIFAENAPIRLVTAFRTAGDNPTQSKTPDVIQNETYSIGWINADNTGNLIPYAEDMNGVLYTLSYNTSYLFEKGMPEYSPEQTYYENSFCQYGGYLYRCKVDETLNIVPTNTNYWDKIETDAYSATNIGTGEGFYASMSGTQFRFKTLIAADNSVVVDSGDDYVSIRAVAATPNLNAVSPISYSAGTISIQAANSSQGGYLTAADWASFNGKLSSTIFSSVNTWSAKNIFSADIDANTIYTTRLKTPYSSSYGSHINHYYTDSNNTEILWLIDGYDTDFVNLGLMPNVENAILGTAANPWMTGFIDSLYISNLNGAPNATSLTSNVSIVPATASLNLGSMASPWLYGYIKRHQMTGYGVAIEPTNDDKGMQLEWIGTSTRILYLAGEAIYTNSDLEVDIGDSTHFFKNVYCSKYYLTSNVNLSPVASGNAMRLTWYDADNSKSRGLDLVGASFRPRNSTEVSLGDQYGLWKDLYLAAGASGGIYFGADTSHTYIRDVTLNTLVLNATANIQLYNNGTLRYNFGNTSFTPRGTSNNVDLGGSGTGFRWNTVYYTTLNPTSDIRLKENIEPLESGLKIVNDLDIKSFTYKNSPDHIEYGIIAQDVVEKYPELISIPDSVEGAYGTYIHNFIFASIRAIQELSAKVDELQQQLMELKK